MLDEEIRYGGFWVRLLVSLIDGIIITLVAAIPYVVLYAIYYFANIQGMVIIYLLAFFDGNLWGLIIGIIYTVKLVASEKKSTFAMRFFNLIIVDKNMQRLTLGHSFGRWAAMLFVCIFTLCLGFLTIIFRQDKRGLHDIIAGTYVIYK
jgi:uncharacterized RDD family membrane protein YckC